MAATTGGVLTSFARSSASRAIQSNPADDVAWAKLFERAGGRGVTVRGAGASYSDAALNSGGTVAVTRGQHLIRPASEDTGVVDVDAGATMAELLAWCVPRGWTVPVVPGTAQLTLGGALAADVHAKNHPTASSFSAHVLAATLLSPVAGVLTVGPHQDPDAFWATAGGLGLTGVIRRLRLKLRPVTSSWLLTRDRAVPDLDSILDLLSQAAQGREHAVAWIDGHAAGAATGRGVVTTAAHLAAADLPTSLSERALEYRPARRRALPTAAGLNLVRPALVRAANAARYAGARRESGDRVRDFTHVFHQLDAVADWPRFYGRHGLVQYQFAVPHAAADVLPWALYALRAAGCPPALVVLKRLGGGTPGHLSFPLPGWTIALDLPTAAARSARRVLDRLDHMVAARGGRVYLVKDSRLHRDLVRQMYPRVPEWRTVRERLDPAGVMTSDLDRRLGLSGRYHGGDR